MVNKRRPSHPKEVESKPILARNRVYLINHMGPSPWPSLPMAIQRKPEKHQSLAGKVVGLDITGNGGGDWRRFTRIGVEVNYTQPLLTGVFLPHPNLNDMWISLKYEKIYELCYNCSIIGHKEKHCQGDTFYLQNLHGIMFFAVGSWLRPENDRIPTDAYQKSNHPSSELEAELSCLINPYTFRASDTIHPVQGSPCISTTSPLPWTAYLMPIVELNPANT
ncbi:hypothetical protein SO802_002867 [Lithocarpus litseifolius]|uniref:Zinc knuckle CX2CX4HX4C domain-containing protein n=1 Tax=Lithocarpus litseifolius TaxID=425828 RepID=A0AAW2DYR0_9ROSI